ncbi:MAG: hypothetical protein QXU74_02795 [Candidatus Aenigmatarchaeota archaeon]
MELKEKCHNLRLAKLLNILKKNLKGILPQRDYIGIVERDYS